MRIHQGDVRAEPLTQGGVVRDPPTEPEHSPAPPDTVDLRGLLGKESIDEAELVEIVCNDQAERWAAHQRVPAECYLNLHPMLQAGGESAFELIYNEYALRESLGEAPSQAEFAWRFPAFADRLRRQLELHQALLPDWETDDESSPPKTAGNEVAASALGGVSFGLHLPGFDLLEELGRGGTGVVYKARQQGLNRLVALKVIRAGVCDDLDTLARFRAEAEASARFQHPNLIHVYEVGEQDGLAYLALEYAAGGSLRKKLAGAPQDPRESARLVESLARAVHYAHQHGIIHRDLKPANVVLTDDGVAKVTDFGLAKLLEHDGGPTRTGDILGTPSYMSPEQARGSSAEITASTDLYSLGAILYEMLTGRPPFQGRTPLATLDLVVNQEPVPPGKLQPNTPRDLETICLKCLEKNPRLRYTDALDLAADLRRYLDGDTIHARSSTVFEKAWKWGKRRPGAAIALGVVAAASTLLVLGAVYAGARLRDSNVQLRHAVAAAQRAGQEANANRVSALEQRNLALKALNQLVFGVQDRLGESPGTRPLRRSLLGMATSGLDEIARGAEASAPDLSRAVAHQKLGEIFRQVGRADDARHQLELARQLSADIATTAPDDIAVSDCLMKASAGLGQLHLDGGRFDAAQQAFESVVQLAEAGISVQPDREESRQGLVEAYFQLGRSLGYKGDLARAETWFRKTRDIAQQWADQEPGNTRFLDTVAASNRKLGDMKKIAGDFGAARDEYLKAIALGKEVLAKEPGNLENKLHLAIALDDFAGVAYRQHQLEEAGQFFAEAERLFSELETADPEDQTIQIHLVLAWYALGRIERDQARHQPAAALFRRALRRLTTLDREGRLGGRRQFTLQYSATLKQEISDCEAAGVALGDIGPIRSRPVPEAAALLLTRTRLLRVEGHETEAFAAAQALSALEPQNVDDLERLSLALAACAASLHDARWQGSSATERKALRQFCADRSIAAFTWAVALGRPAAGNSAKP